MCPNAVRPRTKSVRMSTASPCVDRSALAVKEMVFDFRPQRGITGALDRIAQLSGVSYWKLRKLWNPNLQRYGFTLEADEHEQIQQAWMKHLEEQQTQILARLENIRRLRDLRSGQGESQHEIRF